MSTGILILYALVIPYIVLLIIVDIGMFLRDSPRRRRGHLPSVTVVLPAHNEQERLPATLASLARQDYAGSLEFVIVDDRSTDLTPHIIDSFAESDRRFRRLSLSRPASRLSPTGSAADAGITASDAQHISTAAAHRRRAP